MDRTVRVVLFTVVITFAAVAGLGMFLGFEVGAALVAGGVAAAIGGLLLWGASRRADSFHPTDPDAHLRGVTPSFPGEPDPADGDQASGSDPVRGPDDDPDGPPADDRGPDGRDPDDRDPDGDEHRG